MQYSIFGTQTYQITALYSSGEKKAVKLMETYDANTNKITAPATTILVIRAKLKKMEDNDKHIYHIYHGC